MKRIKMLAILAVLIALALVTVPVLAESKPLEWSTITFRKTGSPDAGERFVIRGNLTGSGVDPVHHIAWDQVLDNRPVEIYRRVGTNTTWNWINTQSTDAWGGFRLPWTEHKTGIRHYMVVFAGETNYPGSYNTITVKFI